MITIPADNVGGVLRARAPFPANALQITCDGTNYTIYLPGDTLPSMPVVSAVLTVTSRQFQLALNQLGFLSAVNAKLIAATDAQKIEWSEAATFARNWQTMQDVIGSTLTGAQLDTVFSTAQGL